MTRGGLAWPRRSFRPVPPLLLLLRAFFVFIVPSILGFRFHRKLSSSCAGGRDSGGGSLDPPQTAAAAAGGGTSGGDNDDEEWRKPPPRGDRYRYRSGGLLLPRAQRPRPRASPTGLAGVAADEMMRSIVDGTAGKVSHDDDDDDGHYGRGLYGWSDDNELRSRERELDDLWCRAFKSALVSMLGDDEDDGDAAKTTDDDRLLRRRRRWWQWWRYRWTRLFGRGGSPGPGGGPSPALLRGLLLGPDEDLEDLYLDGDDYDDDGSSSPSTGRAFGRDCIRMLAGADVGDASSEVCYVVGVPCRPYYRELARRLRRLSICSVGYDAAEDRGGSGGGCGDSESRATATATATAPAKDTDAVGDGGENDAAVPMAVAVVDRYLLDASHFGMSELPPDTPMPPPPPQTPTSCSPPTKDREEAEASLTAAAVEWLRRAGDCNILRILGLRSTVGTLKVAVGDDLPNIPALPPTIASLLEAARVPHPKSTGTEKSPPLSVAARARAKHAHRCFDDDSSFFGTVSGGTAVQNDAAEAVVVRLLTNAAWMNCHAFCGGVGGEEGTAAAAATTTTVFEVRAESGYGARWSADWNTSAATTPTGVGDDEATAGMVCSRPPGKVRFRGFLEPQMEDGHERGWRH